MYYYILNPSAGRGRVNSIQDKLRDRLDALGIGGEFAKTTGPGDATKMAESAIAKGFNTIVAVGGDGTLNEVINGVTRDKVAVGVIPIGQTNRLAYHLGIGDWQQACEVLAARRLVGYNLIAAGQNYFLSELSLGFETGLEEQSNDQESNTLRQKASVLRSNWKQAKDFQPLVCRMRVDERYELEAPLFNLTIANQKFENPLLDNKLVITITEKPSKTGLVSYVLGKSTGAEASTRIKATRVSIDVSPQVGVMIDSKIAGSTPVTVKLTDRQIRFITEKQTNGVQA